MSHSQLRRTHTHAFIPCLLGSFVSQLPLSLSSSVFLSRRVVVASGWLAVHVWNVVNHAVGATTLQRHSSKDSLHSFRVKNDVNAFVTHHSERENHPLHASHASAPFCQCDACLFFVFYHASCLCVSVVTQKMFGLPISSLPDWVHGSLRESPRYKIIHRHC